MTELQQKWIEALRSGKYKQGQGRLRDGDKFCCLGVLCDTVEPTAWTYVEEVGDRWDSCVDMPTDEVSDKVGLTSKEFSALADVNDDYDGYSFSDIADLLQKRFDHDSWTGNGVTIGTELMIQRLSKFDDRSTD